MKIVQIIISVLSFLISVFFVSCSKKQSCDGTPIKWMLAANNNIYTSVDTIICVKNSTDTLFYFKNPLIENVENKRLCNSSCQYAGACPKYYELTTYSLIFSTFDKSQSISVRRNYFTHGNNLETNYDDEYDYNVNGNGFILPGTYSYENIITDSLIVNNKKYNVYRLGYNKVYLYIFKNKMLRYIDLVKKDTLDFLN